MTVDTIDVMAEYDLNRLIEKLRREAESEIWIDERLKDRLFPAFLTVCVNQKWLQMVNKN